jgi:photosystem I P700 chlorophyll a apoprotein A2
MGWLRDYLWLNSSQLINGYNPFGMNSLSVWAWVFFWSFNLCYRIYLCSYVVVTGKLIETLVWAHEKHLCKLSLLER